MNINEMAVSFEDGLSLYGDQCISVIPRQQEHIGLGIRGSVVQYLLG